MERRKLTAEEIQEQIKQVEGWTTQTSDEIDVIMKMFEFDDFKSALSFVNQVGEIAERLDHHPSIAFGWGHAAVTTWTHDAGGLTERDFSLAKEIDTTRE